jgi:hypothetical protein
MNPRLGKLLALGTLAALATPVALVAQVTTGSMSGLVRANDGSAVAGASVSAVFTPTNVRYTGVTSSDGSFHLSGLPVGGPWKVSIAASGFDTQTLDEVSTQLGRDISLDFVIRSEVLKLDRLVVSGSRSQLDAGAMGSAQVLDSSILVNKATARRSLNELVSASPAVTLRAINSVTGREDAMITAAGQNNRYNSWMIDGNRINDSFGLYESGTLAFFNPLSIDSLEQISVQLSPYDTRYSGFTGATINMVTKSGTNEVHGEAYTIVNKDHLFGFRTEGPNPTNLLADGSTVIPHLDQTTKGLFVGGPIWKDHLFFFINWEKHDRNNAPSSAGLQSVAAGDLALIQQRIQQITKVSYGQPGSGAGIKGDDEKRLVKVDWQINNDHRLSVRYSSTEGSVPLYGNLTSTAYGNGLNNSSLAGLSGTGATAFDSHFYSQQRKEKNLSSQLLSHWTSDLKTELSWSQVKQDQYTPVKVVAPEIDIFGVTGVNQAGQTITNGVVVLGTERFRHGNIIHVKTNNYTATAEYRLSTLTFSGGADVSVNDYYNLFRSFSYGVFNYASPADFLNDAPRFFQRNFTDLALKKDYADISNWNQHGVFGNVRWNPTPRFEATAGLRYDWSTSSTHPVFNQLFQTDTGMRNDGTVDGANEYSPRVGFNWAIDQERRTQLHGGFGYFVGRAPWVWWSNSYGNTGLGTFTVSTLPTGGLSGYLSGFDPANPMGTATQTGTSRAEIDLADAGTHMPSLWRGNLTLEHRLPELDSVASLDLVHSINDHSLFLTNDNLRPLGVAADGRTYFYGNPATAANALYPNFTNIYHLHNVRAGEATYVTASWNRPMKASWSYSLSYTRGRSTEAQNNGNTTASGGMSTMVFNANKVEVGTSDFEVHDRLQGMLTRQFEFFRGARTSVSLYYEGRSGNPYSYTFSNDLNRDGVSGNDLFSVPSGPADARFDFSAMPQAQQDALFAYLQSSGLSAYAGSHTPKNVFREHWLNRLDLSFKQEVPLHWNARLKLFADFVNFGTFLARNLFNYTERTLLNSNDTFDHVNVGAGTIDTTTGKIKMTSFTTPTGVMVVDNQASRWRVQVGAAIEF